ncbi:hypothetical protein C8J57DRAFT_1483111 [Mycena rebaudengoi]|nr:hypothetical protein C8J57DRAFT_1483111 [Mycena rebaudengoi]
MVRNLNVPRLRTLRITSVGKRDIVALAGCTSLLSHLKNRLMQDFQSRIWQGNQFIKSAQKQDLVFWWLQILLECSTNLRELSPIRATTSKSCISGPKIYIYFPNLCVAPVQDLMTHASLWLRGHLGLVLPGEAVAFNSSHLCFIGILVLGECPLRPLHLDLSRQHLTAPRATGFQTPGFCRLDSLDREPVWRRTSFGGGRLALYWRRYGRNGPKSHLSLLAGCYTSEKLASGHAAKSGSDLVKNPCSAGAFFIFVRARSAMHPINACWHRDKSGKSLLVDVQQNQEGDSESAAIHYIQALCSTGGSGCIEKSGQ